MVTRIRKINYIYNTSGLFILTVYIPSGSIYENIGANKDKAIDGVSHMLEHIVYKRTEKYTGQEVLKAFTSIGGIFNASTDKDETMFYVKTLTENFELATSLIHNIVVKPVLKAEDIEIERQVVLEELAKYQDDMSDAIYEESTPVLLDKSNIYSPPVIGQKRHLKKMSIEEIIKYYRERYQDIMVVISCDENHRGKIHKYVTKLFGRNGFVDFYEPKLESLSLRFEKKENVKIVSADIHQYNTVVLLPSFKYADMKNSTILNFLKYCLCDAGLYSILTYEMREKRGLVYHVSMDNERRRYLGVLRTSFATSNKNIISILKVMFDVINNIKSNGLTVKNLAFFKTSYANHLQYRFTNDEYRAAWIGENLFYGCVSSEAELLKFVKSITNDDIKRICSEVFSYDKMGIYSTGSYEDIKQIKKEVNDLLLEQIKIQD